MRFDYRRVDSLPRLAWCATITAGETAVVVRHGSWVETRPDCFFEAAWDGDFRTGTFDAATTMLGTGARLHGERVIFATATDTDFYVFTHASDDTLIVSNSLVFAMVRAKTAPDVGYPYYVYDFYALRRLGLTPGSRRLRTADGRHVDVHMYKRFSVDTSLRVEERPTHHHPPPRDFRSYVTTISTTMAAIFDNAAHPERLHPFAPMTTISRGYDSSAVSALSAELGHHDAITFTTDDLGYDDSGEENAACLGLDVIVAGQTDFHELPDHPEAEFCASNPAGAAMPLAIFSPTLEGKILLKGDMGDFMWSTAEVDDACGLRWPQIRALATTSMNEFRLRTGTLVFDVPAIGAIHCHDIHLISRSEEMRPWSIGGEYDRPIPRRISEETGLPRENFGQQKMFGLHRTTLKPESLVDFRRYYGSADVPRSFRRKRRFLDVDTLMAPAELLLYLLKKTPRTAELYKLLATPLMRSTAWRAHDWRRRSPLLYLFHWGFEKTKHRYDM